MDPNKLANQVRRAGLGFSAGICSAGVMYGVLRGYPIMSVLALMTGFYIRRVARDQGPATEEATENV